jgi:misacylated tRNA(Ala) deacylase
MGRTYWPRITRRLFRCGSAPNRATSRAGILPAVSLQLAYSDAYARSVEARVVAVDAAGEAGSAPLVVLDRTVFYPGGGGQPADRGTLLRAADGRAWVVASARKLEGDIVHELAAGDDGSPVEPPAVGDLLVADLEWPRRYALMRTHTALHALCGVVWRDYGAQVTGGNMEPGSGRMDFEFERMSGDLVDEIEAKVNAELAAAREVRVNVLPRDEAFAIPDLIRTKINLLPPGIAEVRTIEIVGLDLQADGGTHVANTREVGGIRVTGYESKGRINKRIRIELANAPEG